MMVWICRIKQQVSVSFSGITMLNAILFTFTTFACCQKILIDQLILWIVCDTLPVLNLQLPLLVRYATHAITTHTVLFGYECLPKCCLVLIVVVVRILRFSVLNETLWFNSLVDGYHLFSLHEAKKSQNAYYFRVILTENFNQQLKRFI